VAALRRARISRSLVSRSPLATATLPRPKSGSLLLDNVQERPEYQIWTRNTPPPPSCRDGRTHTAPAVPVAPHLIIDDPSIYDEQAQPVPSRASKSKHQSRQSDSRPDSAAPQPTTHSPATSFVAGGVPPPTDLRYNAGSLDGNTGNSIPEIPIPKSTQLIYLRIKARKPKSAYKYAEVSNLKQTLLPFLAQLPLLKETNLFQSGRLLFSLYNHKHSSADRGFYYTASFTIVAKGDDEVEMPFPQIPDIILQAQQLQELHLDLPIVSADKNSETIASSLRFALSKEELSIVTSIDFQVRIPPISLGSPTDDFAFLLCNIVSPRIVGQTLSDYRAQVKIEHQRFVSFCKPRKIISSEHGDLLEETIHGSFLLNLEESESRDVLILHRIIFAYFFGLYPRFGSHQQYVLTVPLFNGHFQLSKKPEIIKTLINSLKLDTRFMALIPPKTKRIRQTRDTPSLSSSETESEESYNSRIMKRAEALALLPTIEHDFAADFPPLFDLKYTQLDDALAPIQKPSSIGTATVTVDLRGSLDTIIAQVQQQSAASPTIFPTKARATTAPKDTPHTTARGDNTNRSGRNVENRPNPQHPRQFNASQQRHHHSQSRPLAANQDVYPPSANQDIFTQKILDTFPSIAACRAATVQQTETDGNCLFHAFLAASMDFKLSLGQNPSASNLRAMVTMFLKSNQGNDVLPSAAFLNSPLGYNSPQSTIRMQTPYRLIPNTELPTALVQCKCPTPDRDHIRKGIPAGQLKMAGVEQPLFYKNFEEYITLMAANGTYGEEMEIQALSTLFSVSIGVWTKASEFTSNFSDTITIYYHPKSKGTIFLFTYNGRAHYEWLSFAKAPQNFLSSNKGNETSKSIFILDPPAKPTSPTVAQGNLEQNASHESSDWFSNYLREFRENTAQPLFLRDQLSWPPAESHPYREALNNTEH
jgi:hypothetical protein